MIQPTIEASKSAPMTAASISIAARFRMEVFWLQRSRLATGALGSLEVYGRY